VFYHIRILLTYIIKYLRYITTIIIKNKYPLSQSHNTSTYRFDDRYIYTIFNNTTIDFIVTNVVTVEKIYQFLFKYLLISKI